MADPLSITASVIAIVQLAEKLITLDYTYLGGVKGASKYLQDLVGELQSLGNFLVTLQDYVQADENLESIALQPIDGQNGPLLGCALELRRLQLKLEPKQGLKGIIQNLKWPLKEAEIRQSIARIQRQKNLFVLAFTMDNLTVSKAIKAHVMDLDCTAEEIKASAQDTNTIVHELQTKLEAEASAQDLWR
ncbi:hypothetical protein DFP73DRAFT_634096 [Morchella snyderi]|nr:hypothetical protein DFP73DRAFT_634096 [Morchella snyderi]